MQREIQLFAAARDAVGQSTIAIELPSESTAADLVTAIGRSHPELTPLLAHSRIAVDCAFADNTTPIPADAELALIPPVSGG